LDIENPEDPHPNMEDRKGDVRIAKLLLRIIQRCLPGDRLKTWTYLHAIKGPRRFIRRATTAFSRVDHVYDVLAEFMAQYKPPFSILEFGTAQGYAFAKLLGATRYLHLEDQVTVHGFDSFEGLPVASSAEDRGLMRNPWMTGAYRASYDALHAYAVKHKFHNFRLHKGYFEDSITPDVLEGFRTTPPILVWVDCDLYTSSVTVLQRLIPVLRSGCVIYFDDLDFNYRSRFTGQARLVREINRGRFGEHIELVCDDELSWDSGRVFRFVRFDEGAPEFEALQMRRTPPQARPISDGSPFP
jgi:hypothetical protein